MKKLLYSVAIASLLAACGSPDTHSHLNTRISSSKLAEIAALSGDPGAAASMLATAAQDNPRDAQAQLDYANSLLQQNKVTEARRVLASRIGQVRDASILHGPLGMLYVLTGEGQQAVVEFDAALSSDRGNTRWITNKGVALDLLKRHGEAQALYKQALTSSPDDSTILNDLALSLALSGQKDEALRVAAQVANQADLLPRIKNTIDMVRSDKIGKAG